MRSLHLSLAILVFAVVPLAAQPAAPACTRTIAADVDALDHPLMFNRLGTAFPQGMIFALDDDVVPRSGPTKSAGNVILRSGKRPRPIVLRMNQGDCLTINFTNYLSLSPSDQFQPVTRAASVHVMGVGVVDTIKSDGSFVGRNASGLVPPGGNIRYRIYGEKVGTFLLYSSGSLFGAPAGLGQLMAGLFGALTVEPRGAEYYRSQITAADLALASGPGPNPKGPPLINYNARYPANYPDKTRQCVPVLRMVDVPQAPLNGVCQTGAGLKTYHSDLTAIVTGPGGRNFPQNDNSPEFNTVPASPERRRPWREFTILYHEAADAVQAFKEFYQPPQGGGFTPADLSAVLTNGADNLAINYGTGGISAEILANRFGVGPMEKCVDCRFEEFFLSAWSVGDPAMNVDVPANSPSDESLLEQCQADADNGTPCTTWTSILPPAPGPKATLAKYPDDPSNVYHSYLNDHVKFHILNAGSTASHIHHQHAHQWLHTPNDPNSSYLDSQLLGPGASFTLEIDYGGSGNRNRTVGDSIFHCHFYPHFAGGMWAMWRVHDVFESGTPINADGTVPPNVRALPDAEIANGTPIPAIVPLPTYGMPPLPATVQIVPVCKPGISNCAGNRSQWVGTEAVVVNDPTNPNINPGFPFFIPGVSGHRPPHPAFDYACEQLPNGQCKTDSTGQIVYLDGGLGRHVVLDGNISNEHHNQWDFSKDSTELSVRVLPETGTDVEKRAIKFFSKYQYSSYAPDGTPASYFTNGLPRGPQRGAPFADPAVVDGKGMGDGPRIYKAAVLQMDVVFNKVGWHYPQQRLITLWGDVQSTLTGQRAPEPFFFRANSNDIIEFWHTNLVPSYYELDDFQVRTPTDVIGQHIHLVKFDVTSSDGAGNGFNYEDGTFSPDEVRDRIEAIRNTNHCDANPPPGTYCPTIKPAPSQLGPAPYGQDWRGAQTTVQRWWADPLQGCLNAMQGCGGDKDGDRTMRTVFTHDHFGPSTHQQIGLYAGLLIEPNGSKWLDSSSGTQMGSRYDGGPTSWTANIVTPNIRDSFREFALEFGDNALAYDSGSPSQPVPYNPKYSEPLTNNSTPWGWVSCEHAVNSPLAGGPCPPGGTGSAALITQPGVVTAQQGLGSMSVNYRNEPLPFRVFNPSNASNLPSSATDLSHVYRSITRYYAPMNQQPKGALPGALPTDPFTPLLRGYQNDNVQVRVLVGANLFQHDFVVQGLRWLFEPSGPNSGWRSHQSMGISEHYEFAFKLPVTADNRNPQVKTSFADYLYAPGAGTLDQVQGLWGILRAYNGESGKNLLSDLKPLPNNPGGGVMTNADICPFAGNPVKYDITAVDTSAVPGGQIVYNDRFAGENNIVVQSPLMWVRTSDLKDGVLTKKPEPLILRANAGDCIDITLRNALKSSNPLFTSANQQQMGMNTTVNLFTSMSAGLHPQLVSYDVTRSNGANIGLNPVQTVAPTEVKNFRWYAGAVNTANDGSRSGYAVEFGSANLMTSDPLYQQTQAMIGALIVEPWGASVTEDANTRAQAWVTAPGVERFREFVAIHQNNVNLVWGPSGNDQSGTTNSVNYGSEPMWARYGDVGSTGGTNFNTLDVSAAFSNSLIPPNTTSAVGDPKTPIFTAPAGAPVRFRMLHPDGPGGFPDTIWVLNGHQWQEEPYVNNSRALGVNPLSNVQGSRDGFGFGGAFDILTRAGGPFGVKGDYLYQSFPAFEFPYGNWGVFRVGDVGPGEVVTSAAVPRNVIPDSAPDLNRFNKKRHPHENLKPAERNPKPEELNKKP